MKLHYYPETDSAYIEFSEGAGTKTVEVADGVNVDLGALGELIGIELEQASKHLDSITLKKANRKIPASATSS
jgi:uncharacterized protein YuzE